MFTGLIEEIGKIRSSNKQGDAIEFEIECSKILEDINIDDSISINGVCLTVEKSGKDFFQTTAVEETLRKTTLGNLDQGSKVNLERAMKADKRFGGHYVQGHIDEVSEILNIEKETKNWLFTFKLPDIGKKYIIDRGSITIDGVSLTVAEINDSKFKVAVIPHTLKNTTLGYKKLNQKVNLEYDIIGKYVENLLKFNK